MVENFNDEKDYIFMVKQLLILFLLLFLSGCSAVPATDDNRTDDTDYNIVTDKQPSNGNNSVSFGGEHQFDISTLDIVATNSPPALSIATDKENVPYQSISAASDDANGEDRIFTLQALAVQKNDNTQYTRASDATDWSDVNTARTIAVSKITAPAVSLGFDGNGKISTVVAHFADKTYEATATSDTLSATSLHSSIVDGADNSATTTAITVDRSSHIFGFDTQYMAHISWNLLRENLSTTVVTDNLYKINGVMLAGIETETAKIPSTDTIIFTGAGSGYYGDLDKSYQTIFDIMVDISFVNQIVDISSSNTQRCIGVNNCPLKSSNLDFSAINLSFSENDNAKNDINGAVSLKNRNSSLTGDINARFYGPDANEFGGIFALIEADTRYYYGAFGALNPNIDVDDKIYDDGDGGFPLFATTVTPREAIDYLTYDSFDDASAGALSDGATKTLTLSALAVLRRTGTSPNLLRITKPDNESPLLDITFDSNGHLSAADASFYDTKYTLSGGTPTSSAKLSGATNVTATTNNMNVIRADVNLLDNFSPKYMAYVTWTLVDNVGVDSDGYMVAGIETETTGIDAIPTHNLTITFRGKGLGTYHSDADKYHVAVKFDATARVNFFNQTVVFSSTNTKCVDMLTCGMMLSADDLLNLEIDTINNLSAKYRRGVNAISGDIENADKSMQGRFDARFYGKRAGELGGVFIMKNADKSTYYLGAFGAERPKD